jgi:hypothetical protein
MSAALPFAAPFLTDNQQQPSPTNNQHPTSLNNQHQPTPNTNRHPTTNRTPEAVAQSIREIKQELAGFGLSAVGTGPSGSRKQRQQQPAAAAAAGSSSSSGPQLFGVVCDVTKAGDVANLAAEAQVRCCCVGWCS